jgi:hypothetical protein
VELPLRTLFETPTLAAFAAQIDAARGGAFASPAARRPPLNAAPRPARVPLSFAQQRLWFLAQLDPASAAYNCPVAVRLDGALAIPALRQALTTVVARHESLRTTFPAVAGEPEQRIAPPAVVPLPVVDLTAVPRHRRDRVARWLVTAEARRPFALATGPLLRARLVVLAPDAHVLAVTLHHIVCDGWSLGLLLRELTAAYDAAPDGPAVALPLSPLPLQYADVAQWQRTWLDGPALDAQLAYWRTQLADLPVLELPLDRPRPSVPTNRGESVPFHVRPEVARRLREASGDEGVTLFMTLMAAFQIVLAAHTGLTDVSVSVNLSQRQEPDLDRLIGPLFNTVVIRVPLHECRSFTDLCARVRDVMLAAHDHKDAPFEHVARAVQRAPDPTHRPLSRIRLDLEAPPAPPMTGAIRMQDFAHRYRTVHFDLAVAFLVSPDGLSGTVIYDTDLFLPARIDGLIGSLQECLERVSAAPERALAPLITELRDRVRDASADRIRREEVGVWSRVRARRAGAQSEIVAPGRG